MDGSQTAQLNCLDIDATGDRFVSGGDDKLVKLWNYDEGNCYYVGVGHSEAITRLKISPDQKTIVSVGEGMVYDVWCMTYMFDVWCMMYDVWCMTYLCVMYDVWC